MVHSSFFWANSVMNWKIATKKNSRKTTKQILSDIHQEFYPSVNLRLQNACSRNEEEIKEKASLGLEYDLLKKKITFLSLSLY